MSLHVSPRYQSIRRTITQSQQPEGESANSAESREPTGARAVPESQADTTNSTPDRGTDNRPSERSRHSVYKYPAVKFLTRPDFFPILQANEVCIFLRYINKVGRDFETMFTEIRIVQKYFFFFFGCLFFFHIEKGFEKLL